VDLQKQLEPLRDLRPETLPHEELVRHFVSQTALIEHLLGVVREQAERIDELQGEIRRLRRLPDRPRGTGGPGTPSAGETGGGSSQSSAHSSEQEPGCFERCVRTSLVGLAGESPAPVGTQPPGS
jgi:hypothetical protein